MSWLPPPSPTAAERRRRRWRPRVLEEQDADVERLSYLVVDEIVGSSVGLVLSDWPDADEQGRLRFGGGEQPLKLRRPRARS
jgi:hypothetical protein